MSQSATFYPINSNDFNEIRRNPNIQFINSREDYVTFQGTHEGLRFVLSKGVSNQEAELINEIFYPTVHTGDTSQYVFPNTVEQGEFIDVTDDKNFEAFDREPVLYHDPEKIKQIASLLNNVSDEHFLMQFDPVELNRENIYPWCWNSKKEDNQAYNEKHILEDFQNLKKLFNAVSVTDEYLLCFVG